MRVANSLLIASLIVSPGIVLGEEPAVQDIVSFSAIVDGRVHNLRIPLDDILQSPAWSPDTGGEPPVTVGEATRLGVEEFTRHFKESDWVLRNISLRPLSQGHWAYFLDWGHKVEGVIGMVVVPVLMSGKAVLLDQLVPAGPRAE